MRSMKYIYGIGAVFITTVCLLHDPTCVSATEPVADELTEAEYSEPEYSEPEYSEPEADSEEPVTGDEDAAEEYSQTYEEAPAEEYDWEAGDNAEGKQRVPAPKLGSVKNCGKYIQVKWKLPKKSVDGILIEVGRDAKFATCEQTVTVVDPTAGHSEIYDLTDQTVYYIRIRAFLQRGDEYQFSKWSKSKEVEFGNVVTAVTITNNPGRMPVGKTFILKAEVSPGNLKGQNIEWASENPETASVDPKGRVKAIHPGTAIISASCGGKKGSCKITVNIKGIITIIDDDGNREFIKKMLPIIKDKKVSIATAVVPTWADKRKRFMTWDEIAMCADSGAEVLCHTLKHHGPAETSKMKGGKIRGEYAKAQEMMRKHGYDGDILVYSRSTGKIKKAQKAASKVYKCGIYCAGSRINDIGADMYFLQRYRLEPFLGSDPKVIRGWIDKTKKGGGWMIWSIHCGTPPVNDKALNNLRNLIDYARKQGVEIVTAKEGYGRFTSGE